MSRLCVVCGRKHNVVIQDRTTEIVLQEIDRCIECLFRNMTVHHLEGISFGKQHNLDTEEVQDQRSEGQS